MQAFASAVILVYAAVLAVGGFAGWRLSGSRISLTAGLASAAALAVAYRLSQTFPFGGYVLATGISIALAVLFARRFRKTKKFLPSGVLLLLSGVAAALLGWATALSR